MHSHQHSPSHIQSKTSHTISKEFTLIQFGFSTIPTHLFSKPFSALRSVNCFCGMLMLSSIFNESVLIRRPETTRDWARLDPDKKNRVPDKVSQYPASEEASKLLRWLLYNADAKGPDMKQMNSERLGSGI